MSDINGYELICIYLFALIVSLSLSLWLIIILSWTYSIRSIQITNSNMQNNSDRRFNNRMNRKIKAKRSFVQ